MIRYDLEWCDKYLDEELDKMGSDLFPLEIKLNRFITIANSFVRATTQVLEINQEVSDDIKPLITEAKFTLIQDPNNLNIWNCPEPADYIRLISLVPLFLDPIDSIEKRKAKVVDIIKEGQADVYDRDPHRMPTHEYPQVTRYANLFKVNVGGTGIPYTRAFLSYVKRPTFAPMNMPLQRIVNLPDMSIDRILLKTADSLRFSAGDSDAPVQYQFDNTYGKRK